MQLCTQKAGKALALILGSLELVAGKPLMNSMTKRVNGTDSSSLPAETYFRETIASNLLYGHIICMTISWVGVFPVVLNLNLARSNLRYPAHLVCLCFHGAGTILGLAYNSKTSDLYPKNAHQTLGWILTAIILIQFCLGLFRSNTGYAKITFDKEETQMHSFHSECTLGDGPHDISPGSSSTLPSRESGPDPPLQPSFKDTDDSESNPETHDDRESETLFDVPLLKSNHGRDETFTGSMSWNKRWANVSGSHKLVQILESVYDTLDGALIILAFIAVCTGIVTMAGIFRDKHVFNGLAHFIKGGAFFWYGILTLSRWAGCFAKFGWAWNLRFSTPATLRNVSMEGVESFVIFFYGITNVFLEHLSGWGGAWIAQDFEHVAISLLFIGGGMCGMLVESTKLREFLHRSTGTPNTASKELGIYQSGFSLNPMPALVIFVLGMVMGGHHQMSSESSMMHKQFGNLLTGAAAARAVTYLILYLSPPESTVPSRPPSELLTTFCLMCGGLMLMASNSDTVQAMIDNHIDAMFVTTVTMGLTAALMSWVIIVLGVRGWAECRTERRQQRVLTRN